jgi:hypothetical protein
MNNEFSPIDLRAERKRFHQNIITLALGIKNPAFWKRLEQVKSQWIPWNRQHHF